jgi:hypothetical protein
VLGSARREGRRRGGHTAGGCSVPEKGDLDTWRRAPVAAVAQSSPIERQRAVGDSGNCSAEGANTNTGPVLRHMGRSFFQTVVFQPRC